MIASLRNGPRLAGQATAAAATAANGETGCCRSSGRKFQAQSRTRLGANNRLARGSGSRSAMAAMASVMDQVVVDGDTERRLKGRRAAVYIKVQLCPVGCGYGLRSKRAVTAVTAGRDRGGSRTATRGGTPRFSARMEGAQRPRRQPRSRSVVGGGKSRHRREKCGQDDAIAVAAMAGNERGSGTTTADAAS